jgi:hypothetical protein
MREFFRGWKRKVGVVTLVLATLYFAQMYFAQIPQPVVIDTPGDVRALRQLQQRASMRWPDRRP